MENLVLCPSVSVCAGGGGLSDVDTEYLPHLLFTSFIEPGKLLLLNLVRLTGQ